MLRSSFCFGLTLTVLVSILHAEDKAVESALDEKLAKVDALFADCDRLDQPGCAVGIVSRGKLIYKKGFGSANLVYEVPNTPSTLFEMASAAKGLPPPASHS